MGGTMSVSLRNGFRCVPEPTASIEDMLIVVGDQLVALLCSSILYKSLKSPVYSSPAYY